MTVLSMASGWINALCWLWCHSRVPRREAVGPQVPIEVTQTRLADIHIPAPVEIEIATPVLTGLAHPGSSSIISGLTEQVFMDSVQAKGHIDRIPRFRILIMGRANAGKTTILQRVCNTTDPPEVFRSEGDRVDAATVQGLLVRGHHNIEDQLVFKSNPHFVFHDSCGFEAGSEAQFDIMKRFVVERANTPKLDKRIHAIWFCIPLNENHRMVLAAERKFFDECETGHVPVIVLLTKADTLELEAIQEIEDLQLGMGETRIIDIQKRMLAESLVQVKGWLNGLRFPPHDFLPLTRMQQDDASCVALLKCTADSLSEESLQKLLISTQQTNLALCIDFAVKKSLKSCMKDGYGYNEPKQLAILLSSWFPYDFAEAADSAWELWDLWHQMDTNLMTFIHNPSTFQMPTLSSSLKSPMRFIAEHGIGTILVFESFYLLQGKKESQQDIQAQLTLAIENYQMSGVQDRVIKLIEAAFYKHGPDLEALCPILVDIAKDNQMSKNLLK